MHIKNSNMINSAEKNFDILAINFVSYVILIDQQNYFQICIKLNFYFSKIVRSMCSVNKHIYVIREYTIIIHAY